LRVAFPISIIIGITVIACSNGSSTTPLPTLESDTLPAAVSPVSSLNAPEATFVPQEYQVTVSAGQDTEAATAFFPSRVTIRAGDTVNWVLNSDEIHTVTFLTGTDLPEFVVPIPGAEPGIVMLNPSVAFPTRFASSPVETFDGTRLVNSGILSKEAPVGRQPNDRLSVTFNTPGVFDYICAVHGPLMLGSVIVLEKSVPMVPTPQQVETAADIEIKKTSAKFKLVRQQFHTTRNERGPGGTDLWFVGVGASGIFDPRIQIFEFFPNELTVKSGDTVVWGATEGAHTVTFNPIRPDPGLIVSLRQAIGPPILALNPQVLNPSKPVAVFDSSQYFNSGDIGVFGAAGASWALTFDEPGTFDYFCAIHSELGMEGTITVVSR